MDIFSKNPDSFTPLMHPEKSKDFQSTGRNLMDKRLRLICHSFLHITLLLTLSPIANADISPGDYFTSDAVGARIQMPPAVTGKFDSTGGLLGFANAQNTMGGMVFGGSAGGVQSGASRAIRTLLPLLGFEVRATYVDAVNPDGSTTSQFSVSNDTGIEIFMQLDVRQGDSGNYMAVLGNSGMNEQTTLSAMVSKMSNSIEFRKPEPSTSITDIGGLVLVANASNSDVVGSGSLHTADESFLVTCSDGRYSYFSKDSFLISFGDGPSQSSNESIEHTGIFTSHADFAGNQLVSLHSGDKGTFVFNVTVSNGSVYLDQTPYQQTGTSEQQCD